ncbi:MAG: hypothetical protein KatS3mg131_2239 [Candidatus Tectimicrobiota bacterium]|nr:MAG: hypothetical protein KatS3mg131_2239 [Candidatus Tectomicrobia bacterium]
MTQEIKVTTTYMLTCLSPVHVGSGVQLGHFDGVYADRQWHRIDLERVLTHGLDAAALARAMDARDFAWLDLLRARQLPPEAVAAYTLRCPEDPARVPIREAIKDAYGQPYLPGTSVKGAVRTAVLWSLAKDSAEHQAFLRQYLTLCQLKDELLNKLRQQRAFEDAETHRAILAELVGREQAQHYQQTLYRLCGVREGALQRDWRRLQQRLQGLGRRREWLAQDVERELLGRTPNHDLMRAVQVQDSTACGLERLAVGLVWTYTLRGQRLVEKREADGEYKAFVEWLLPDTALRVAIGLDVFLFSPAANRDLRLRGAREEAVRQLARTCNAYARALIAAEKAFYTEHGLEPLRDFYAELEATLVALPEGGFLLNVGWGGGWEMKTLGDLARTVLGDNGFQALRQRYRLGAVPRTGQLDHTAPFPKTRRVAYEDGAARWALGWVQLVPQEG